MPKKTRVKTKVKKPLICKWCLEEFIPKRSDALTCSKRCSSNYSYRKSQQKRQKLGLRKDFYSSQTDEKLMADVKAFVMRVKAQSYNVDVVDCFILIDLFDRVFPKLYNVPHRTDIEKSCSEMFIRLSKWMIITNSKAPQ